MKKDFIYGNASPNARQRIKNRSEMLILLPVLLENI